jgi:hypothetical protein
VPFQAGLKLNQAGALLHAVVLNQVLEQFGHTDVLGPQAGKLAGGDFPESALQ